MYLQITDQLRDYIERELAVLEALHADDPNPVRIRIISNLIFLVCVSRFLLESNLDEVFTHFAIFMHTYFFMLVLKIRYLFSPVLRNFFHA